MKDPFGTPIQAGDSCFYSPAQSRGVKSQPPEWATVLRLSPSRVIIRRDNSEDETITTHTRVVIAKRPEQDWTTKNFVIYSDFPAYNEGDEEMGPQDFGGEPSGFSVQGPDDEIIAEFGDHYHDKGMDRAEAYIEGYCDAAGWKATVEHDERVVEGIY